MTKVSQKIRYLNEKQDTSVTFHKNFDRGVLYLLRDEATAL